MTSVLNKLKGNSSKLAQGSKLPTGHALKEDNPEQGTVSLDKLVGKSEYIYQRQKNMGEGGRKGGGGRRRR